MVWCWPVWSCGLAPDRCVGCCVSSRRRHTRCALVTGVQTCALPISLLRQRFDELSTLKAHDGDPANAAQLDRRAREDAELLTTLLRGQGYYDAQVTTGIGRRDGKLLVTLTADPGAL